MIIVIYDFLLLMYNNYFLIRGIFHLNFIRLSSSFNVSLKFHAYLELNISRNYHLIEIDNRID